MSVATKPGAGAIYLAGAGGIVGGVGLVSIMLIPSWMLLVQTYALLLTALIIFVTTRHLQLNLRRRSLRLKKNGAQGTRRRSTDYYLFVLGSGGHTKEMLMMMDDGFSNFSSFHRRYLISSHDTMSENHLEDYEADLKELSQANDQSPGSFDKCFVVRARRVHQPLWTTPISALFSIVDIFPVLLSPPANPVGAQLRYPTHIFSNGPATGFFVAMAVHLLKMFYLVPQDAMKFVYIESWARISTLSLTGKLIHYTGIADVFLVQHQEVAAKYGVGNAGEMVFNSRRPAV